MSHRNSMPKPSASERTLRRYRDRHDISTPEDIVHYKELTKLKDKIKEWFNPKPKENIFGD